MIRAISFPYLWVLLSRSAVDQCNVKSRLYTERLLQLAEESGSIGMLRAERFLKYIKDLILGYCYPDIFQGLLLH